ncbi:MAG: methionine aminotransferase [Cyclobacteriaceae bacterium]|nr:methionine aminotransferase [Cyclobacteriaceae bacterium]
MKPSDPVTGSKLPATGTSIFTVMSQMALECGAINLAQGFPDFEVDPDLVERVAFYMKKGYNQYALSHGIPGLRENIARMIDRQWGVFVDFRDQLTITSGATEALYAAISVVTNPGDEVLLFDPAYDSYDPVIRLNGGIPRHINLQFPDYSLPWDQIDAAISPRTKAMVINSPHNPTGTVLSHDDMLRIQELAIRHNLFVISDEVYCHLVYDGVAHRSVLHYPALANRSMAVFSFGKTFHTTGWKMGYAVASPAITHELRKIHQFLTFSVHTPTQYALADFLGQEEKYLSLPSFFSQKRDRFLAGLTGTLFRARPSAGTYFQLVSYEGVSSLGDVEMAEKMTKEMGVASIPVSVFHEDQTDKKLLRFCFAKTDETLQKAAKLLQSIR